MATMSRLRRPWMRGGRACLLLWLPACTIPEVTLDPMDATVDPVASHLLDVRWPCTGEGCADVEAVARIANSIRDEAGRVGVPVSLMIGVLMAVCLYQTMPIHDDAWRECPDDPRSVSGSVCRGAEVLADFMARHDITDALLRYNGCRQLRCAGYPLKVMSEADAFGGG